MNFRRMRFVVVMLLTVMPSLYCQASNGGEQDTTAQFTFKFRINDALLLKDYKDNATQLAKLKAIVGDTVSIIPYSIDVFGTSSPEGNNDNNLKLAKDRAMAVRGYLRWKYPYLKEISISTDCQIADWSDIVILIQKDELMPDRDKVLSILRSNRDTSAKTASLQALPQATYRYLVNTTFSQSREAVTCVVHYRTKINVPKTVTAKEGAKHEQIESVAEVEQPTPIFPSPIQEESTINRTQKILFAIKTDLVQWSGVTPALDGLHAITPNLGVELYFRNRWSIEGVYSYSNWNTFTGDNQLWAVSQGSIEPRYWFKNGGVFCGFFLGVYGQYGSYDIQTQDSGNTGAFFGTGLSSGYLCKLSQHWALELGVRAGYRQVSNTLYDIEQGHDYYNRESVRSNFLPQVKLSIVYRIGKRTK